MLVDKTPAQAVRHLMKLYRERNAVFDLTAVATRLDAEIAFTETYLKTKWDSSLQGIDYIKKRALKEL